MGLTIGEPIKILGKKYNTGRFICKDGRTIYDSELKIYLVKSIYDEDAGLVDITRDATMSSVACFLSALNVDHYIYLLELKKYCDPFAPLNPPKKYHITKLIER